MISHPCLGQISLPPSGLSPYNLLHHVIIEQRKKSSMSVSVMAHDPKTTAIMKF